MHDQAHLFWSHKVHSWLRGKSVDLSIGELDVSAVFSNAKTQHTQTWHQNGLSSVARCQALSLQPLQGLAPSKAAREHLPEPYLSAVNQGLRERPKFISKMKCGCHGHVDTGSLPLVTGEAAFVYLQIVTNLRSLHFVFTSA